MQPGDKYPPSKGWLRVTFDGVAGIVREMLNAPILVIIALVRAAVSITRHVDGVEKQQAIQAKEIELSELRAQNDLKKCSMDMGYGDEYDNWREKVGAERGQAAGGAVGAAFGR